jgi:ribosomal protein S18 acetylase RimI-like enzyme
VTLGNVRVRPAAPSDISELIALSANNGVVDDISRRGRRADTATLADRYADLVTNPERLVLVAVQDRAAVQHKIAAQDKLAASDKIAAQDKLAAPDKILPQDKTEEVIGFCVMVEENVGVLTPTPTLYIPRLLVAPSSRRRGVGRALLTGAVHHAEECGIDHVVVGAQSGARDAHRYLTRLSLGILESVDRVALRRRRSLRAGLPRRVAGRGI